MVLPKNCLMKQIGNVLWESNGHMTGSFHECLRRRHLQPVDSITICFVEAQQAAIQFCERTRVDDVIHGLLLSAITEWGRGENTIYAC